MARKQHESTVETIEGVIDVEMKEIRKEYKHFERFRDENSLLFGIFVLALVALVIINTLFWVQFTSKRYEKQNRQTATIANLTAKKSLQTAHNFAVSAKVENVGTSTDPDPAFPLKDGEALLTMSITITNNSGFVQQFIPTSQLYVRTVDGDYFIMHPSIKLTDPIQPVDALQPGKSVTGKVSFAILKDTSKPLLYIDTMWDDSTPLVIDVLH